MFLSIATMETNRSPVKPWYPYKVNISSSLHPPYNAFLKNPIHETQNSSAIISPGPPKSTWVKIKCHRLLIEVIKHIVFLSMPLRIQLHEFLFHFFIAHSWVNLFSQDYTDLKDKVDEALSCVKADFIPTICRGQDILCYHDTSDGQFKEYDFDKLVLLVFTVIPSKIKI